jgi:uncharacterized protein (TIGR02284 family)
VCVLAVRAFVSLSRRSAKTHFRSLLNSWQETRERGAKCDSLFMKKQNEVVDSLIETLKDGQQGFKEAAENVKDPQLKSLFHDFAQQRARLLVELRSKAQSPDERESDVSGSAAGALHRGWINLKSALTKGDDHAILAECERGEDSAVQEYQKALNNGLSAPVREIVSRQYTDIKAAHDRIRDLRDATKN